MGSVPFQLLRGQNADKSRTALRAGYSWRTGTFGAWPIPTDASKKRLLVGLGFIDNVSAEVWHYEVSGKQVLLQSRDLDWVPRINVVIDSRARKGILGTVGRMGPASERESCDDFSTSSEVSINSG